MRLSERLEAAASEVFAREIRTKAAPDDSLWFVDATTSNLLLEAAALAKRYEDAPVAKAAYYYRPTMGAATGIMFEGPDFTPLAGQRVRIVLDKEG